MSEMPPGGRSVDHAIEVVGLVKRFGKVEAVRGISFAVARGSATALLGGNGAGKTSTLSMLLGVLLPTAGTVTVLGEDIARHRYRVLPRMNFTSPYVDLPKSLTVTENLKVFAGLYGVPHIKARIAELVEQLDIGSFRHRPYGTLSAGQRTRVSIAKALLNRPEVLLLDEPTASLDPDVGDRVRTQLMDYRRRSGATLLLASHNMPEVERMCDTVLMMRAGKIVDSGSPANLIARYGRRTMEEVFLDVARAGDAAGALPAKQESRA
jgi:ABC-2 type transport system ATP-binding protein